MVKMADSQNITVLIAFHDPKIAGLLNSIVTSRYDVDITTVTNASEFFECGYAHKYDIVLLDNVFTKDTFEVLGYFRNLKANISTPVILFSSFLTETDYNKATALDVLDFLAKPFNLEHIFSMMGYVLHKKNSATVGIERRQSVRCDKKVSLKCYIYGSSGARTFDNKHCVISDDISISGLCFSNSVGFSLNEKIQIDIVLDSTYNNETVIHTAAIVKWLNKNDSLNAKVGVEFCNMPVTDRLALSSSLFSV